MMDLRNDVERMLADLRRHWNRLQVVGRDMTTRERRVLDDLDAAMARLRILRQTMDAPD